jgi:hypothetical protein
MQNSSDQTIFFSGAASKDAFARLQYANNFNHDKQSDLLSTIMGLLAKARKPKDCLELTEIQDSEQMK